MKSPWEVWLHEPTGSVEVRPPVHYWPEGLRWLGRIYKNRGVWISCKAKEMGYTEAHIRLLVAAHEATLNA